MAIGGNKKEQKEFASKKIGLFLGNVICINPSEEDFKELLGIELSEDSKATEYLGEKEGNATLRVSVWLEDEKSKDKFNLNFFLENKIRENKDGTKGQFINNVGNCSWASDPNDLPDWFKKRAYREAYVGEEDLYNFLHTWLGSLDYRDSETTLELDWKKLMKGNVKELREQIDGEFTTPFGALATVVTKEKDGEIKEYQGIYNKSFIPEYAIKNFRLIDYMNPDVVAELAAKKPKDLKIHEKFVLSVLDPEYGCRDAVWLKDIIEYDPNNFIVASNEVIDESNSKY